MGRLPELGVANPSPNPETLGDTDLNAPVLELEVRTDDDWVIDCTPVQCSHSRDAVAAVIWLAGPTTRVFPRWRPVVEERLLGRRADPAVRYCRRGTVTTSAHRQMSTLR